MLSLDDQIEIYTDPHFNASSAAQRFFAQYGETEITKKLNDMGKIQHSIEAVLKQHVKMNYPAFLEATDQIHKVGSEMSSLKQLIENTQKLIIDARGTRLADSRAMRSNSLLPQLNYRKAAEELRNQQKQNNQKELPAWLSKAADELAQYIIEQQYQKAVNIVLKTRNYVENLDRYTSSEVAQEILRTVNIRSAHLAQTIQTSLLSLPTSPLWGNDEQIKRLQLLVALGEGGRAVGGFIQLRQVLLQRAMCSVRITPDTLFYVQELSRTFWQELAEALRLFYSLFQGGGGPGGGGGVGGLSLPPSAFSPSLISSVSQQMVEWVVGQVGEFVRLSLRQLSLGGGEASALLLLHFRQVKAPGEGREKGEEETGRASLRRSSTYRISPPPSSSSSSSPPAPMGGLTLLAHYLSLSSLFCSSYQPLFTPSAGGLSLPLLPLFLHQSLPPLHSLSLQYLEPFLGEVAGQVRHDPLLSHRVPSKQAGLREKGTGTGGVEAGDEVRVVSSSYLWLVQVCNHFYDEITALLRGPAEPLPLSPEDLSSSSLPPLPLSSAPYPHSSLCEVQLSLLSVWQRLLLRYVSALEGLDASSLSPPQTLVLSSSLLALTQLLLPSVQRRVEREFVVERVGLLPVSPQVVFSTLLSKVNAMQTQLLSLSK